jgi:hypothetical protein
MRLWLGQGEQFGVGRQGWPPGPGGLAEVIIELDVECGRKGVQVSPHRLT